MGACNDVVRLCSLWSSVLEPDFTKVGPSLRWTTISFGHTADALRRTDTGINENFPSVLEYEIPAFLADKTSDRNGTTEAYFMLPLTATNAVYAMWIGMRVVTHSPPAAS